MAPKTAKPKGEANKEAGKKKQEKEAAALSEELFEEDTWKACVSLVVESCAEDEHLIQMLTTAVQELKPKLFTILTWDDTLAKIHEFGNPKSKKPDKTPKFFEITEPAKVMLDAGEEIPVDLMAKLIKFQLLRIKNDDLRQRQAESVVNTKTAPSSAVKEKGATKDKKGKATPPVLEKKTKLKRRDEVDPPDYIDDEPDHGLQHYVLIVGFYLPHLCGELDSIGVQVSNVIRLSAEVGIHTGDIEDNEGNQNTAATDTETDEACVKRLAAQRLKHFWSGLRPHLDSGPPDSKLNDVAQLDFSLNLPIDNIQGPQAKFMVFKSIARLIYDSVEWRRQHRHYLEKLKIIDVPKLTAPEPQTLKADVTQATSPPTPEKPSLTTEADMSHYNKLLDTVPPESCSVPLILHCMLEQVVLISDPEKPDSSQDTKKTTDSTGPHLDHQLVSCMLHGLLPLVYTENEKGNLVNGLLPLVHTEEDRHRLLKKFGSNKTKCSVTQVVRHHDERTRRLRECHDGELFDPVQVERDMLRFSPVDGLIQSVTRMKNASCWRAIKQQLQPYFSDDVVSWPEVERLFDQSVFESMPLTELSCEGALQKPTAPLCPLPSAQLPTSANPWGDPLSFAKQKLWQLQHQESTFVTDNSEHTEVKLPLLCELSDIQSCRQRILFDWHYFEHHNATIFPQVLQKASDQYRCLDTFAGSNKNCLYVYCHNPMDKDRKCQESWEVTLHSSIKFRKYLENVADKISEWTKEEESKREALNKETPVETQKVEEMVPTAVNQEPEPEPEPEPVIRKGSLKAWKLEQECLKAKELDKNNKKETVQKGKTTKEAAPAKDKREQNIFKEGPPSGKKNKKKSPPSAVIRSAPSANLAKTQTDDTKEDEIKEPPEDFKGFVGYNMDGKLIHISGDDQYLYPSDGGCIIVETASYVEGSTLVKTAVKKDGHSFYTHVNHIVEELIPPPQPPSLQTLPKEKTNVYARETKVRQGSLTALLDSGIRLSYSFFGPTGQCTESINASSTQHSETSTNEEAHLQHPSSPTEQQSSQDVETGLVPPSYPFNRLSLSLPNGLLLQLLREDTQGLQPEEMGMMVKMSFPMLEKKDAGEICDSSLSKEASRLIMSQGTVVRNLRDGSTEVLFADGSVSFSQDSGPVWAPVSDEDDSITETEDDTNEQSAAHNEETERGFWSTTTPAGLRICTVGTSHRCIPTPPLLLFKATDPVTKEVLVTREDGVVSVENPNGSMIVEHTDGTRITSLYEDSLPLHNGERPEITTLMSSFVDCFSPHNLGVMEDHSRGVANNCPGYFELGGEEEDRIGCTRFEHSDQSLTGSRKSSGSASECVPVTEKVALVENNGCATVAMYPERHMAHVFLADGTVITGNNKGAYQVFPPNSGLFQIQSDGKCVYTSDLLDTPRPKGSSAGTQSAVYTMSHCEGVVCDVMDPDGNRFQVAENGTVSVVNVSPDASRLGNQEDQEMRSIVSGHEHKPRLFIVHENGSGTELLHSQTVEDLLFQAYSDPSVAIMKELLPDSQDVFGITILKPCHESVWSQWLLAKQNADITPPNLRNRSWHDFPREEVRPGPPFGTNLMWGLSLTPRSLQVSPINHTPPIRNCPKVLEMRELQQHRPFTSPLRNNLDSQLKGYIDTLMEKEQRLERMKIKDPRSVTESGRASDLLHLVLSFAEEEDSSQITEKLISDMRSLYMQGLGKSNASDETSSPACESFALVRDSKWPERLAQQRLDLCEERAMREALKRKTVVPFFHLENLSLYESLLHEEQSNTRTQVSPRLESAQRERTKKEIQPPSHDTDQPRQSKVKLPTSIQKPKSVPSHQDEQCFPPTNTKNPVSPWIENAQKEKKKLSAKPMKPTASASASPLAVKSAAKSPTDSRAAAESRLKASSTLFKSVHNDVTGQPRLSKVKLPTCIQTTKPKSVPNYQFLSVEEPVRRRCRTVSLLNPDAVVRGFHLHPPTVDFGAVLEGTTSCVTVVMKNVGVDTCRFNIKQPPRNTGLRVLYNPGPVAAGLHTELKIQLLALYSFQPGERETARSLSQDITIPTETEILYLPVSATICPEQLDDIWKKDHTRGHD